MWKNDNFVENDYNHMNILLKYGLWANVYYNMEYDSEIGSAGVCMQEIESHKGVSTIDRAGLLM